MWWKKVTYYKFFLVAGVLALVSILCILIAKSFLPPVIPIFFGKPTGDEQLASYWFLFTIPGISIIISTINIIVSTSGKDEFIKKVLAVGSFLISFMATVTVTKIILLVGFF